MSRCTAPVRGHRSPSAAAECPGCRNRGNYGYYSRPSSLYQTSQSSGNGPNRYGTNRSGSRPRWSRASSSVIYTAAEVRSLEPIRNKVEERMKSLPDLRDVFLCHAWDDRGGAAKNLHDLLESCNVSVWFSEKDVQLGAQLLREIDKGLAKSRVGIVLVTPAFIERIKKEGIAEKELSALLALDLLVPVAHETTFEKLREISPLLASRSGLSSAEDSMAVVADKIAELVAVTP